MAVLSYARLGKMRLNAARLNYYQPWVKVLINGTVRTNETFVSSLTIQHVLNHEKDTCAMRVSGFVPVKGQEVKVYVGDTDLTHQLFGGHILDVQQGYEPLADGSVLVVYDLNAVDYTWLLDRRKVTKKYTSQSATAIIQDLITTFTSGFTTNKVVSGLATLDEITFTNEDVSDAITRVMERVGGYWYCDYAKDIHAFLSEDETAGDITDASPRTMSGIVQSIDLSQVATRVVATGGGSVALSDVDAGTTTLPIEESGWYSGSGGSVQSGPQTITYTGIAGTTETGSTTGYIAPPPAFGSATPNTVGSLANGTYGVAMTYLTDEGETTIGVSSSVVLSGSNDSISLTGIPIPSDPKVTDRRLYITDAGGSTYKLYGNIGLVVTVNDVVSTGTTAAPSSNTAGFSSESQPAGSTSIPVEDLSVFSSAGWALVGDQVFRYTGRSASTGSGTLTGIPASGTGSLTAPVRAGTVKAVPHLTGIPSSGAGAIQYAIKKGDPVNLFVTVNDSTAQTNMAGFVGGDGIHEAHFQDGNLGLTELTAAATALLTERKDPIETNTYTTRDQTQQVGRAVTISLTNPAISGTYKIQRVTLTQFDPHGPSTAVLFPTRRVDASSKRFSFEDLLRQIRKVA